MKDILGVDDDEIFDDDELDAGEPKPGEGDDGKGAGDGTGDDAKGKGADVLKRMANLEKQIKDSQSHISRVETENNELRGRLSGHTKTPEQIAEEEKLKEDSDRLLSGDGVGVIKEIVADEVNKAITPVSEKVDSNISNNIASESLKAVMRKYEFPTDNKKIMEKLKKELFYIPLAIKQTDPQGAFLRAMKALDDGKHLKKREAPYFETGGGKRPAGKGKTPQEIAKQAIIDAPAKQKVLGI